MSKTSGLATIPISVMRKVTVFAACLMMGQSFAQSTWTNGDIVTHLGIGALGADISAFNVDSLTTTYGLQASYNASGIGPAFLADDYFSGLSRPVDAIRIPWYIGNLTQPEMSRVYVKIFIGDPSTGGQLLYENFDGGAILGTAPYVNPNTNRNVYRTSGSTGAAATASTRRINQTTVRINPTVNLVSGQQYFFAWSFDSPSGTSVFCPTLPRRGNGLQELMSNGVPSWTAALGTATNPSSTVDLPFELTFGGGDFPPLIIYPTESDVIEGIAFDGTVEDLVVSDDRRMTWISDTDSQACEVEMRSTSSYFTIKECRLGVEVVSGRQGLALEIQMYNFVLEQWEVFGFVAPTADTQLQARVFQNASRMVGPLGLVRARIRWQPINDDDPAGDGWMLGIDWCRWRLTV